MKKMTKIWSFVLALGLITGVNAQKKTHTLRTEYTIEASADQVWKVVGEEFGDIAKSHPGVVHSAYENGNTQGGEGCERVCSFNESGSKFTKERQVNYNPDDYTFDVKIYRTQGLPLDTNYGGAVYKVIPVDANSSKFVFEVEYRTKPAFMGALAKGKFKRSIDNYALAVHHYVMTGEEITKDNFKSIKKKYKKA